MDLAETEDRGEDERERLKVKYSPAIDSVHIFTFFFSSKVEIAVGKSQSWKGNKIGRSVHWSQA